MSYQGHNTALLLAGLVQGECTAGEVLDRVERSIQRKINGAGVYVQLDRLEKNGLVTSRLGSEPGRSGRRPRLWRITGAGERALREIELSKQGVTYGLA